MSFTGPHPTPHGPASSRGITLTSLIAGIASAERLSDVLPALHQHALAVTGGSRSLLFEHNPRTGALQPTSAHRVPELVLTPWLTEEAHDGVVAQAFSCGGAMFVDDLQQQLPDLALRLGSETALLIPIGTNAERVALLAVGFDAAPDRAEASDAAGQIADTFATSIELLRARTERQLHRDLRELVEIFTAELISNEPVQKALTRLCEGIARTTSSDRVSAWLHNRERRDLLLIGSSDSDGANEVRISADDDSAPIALALRQRHAAVWPADDAATAAITVTLRGYRRALGTLLLEGVRLGIGGELGLLDAMDEMGRRVAGTLETIQLVDDVREHHSDLQGAFNSLVHLAVMTDAHGIIRHVNDAFVRRTKRTREQLVGQPLADCLSQELAAWVRELPSSPLPGGFVVREMEDSGLNGMFFVTMSDFCDRDGSVRGRVFMAPDRVAVGHLEVEREARRNQMTQSEKLAALGQFVAGIAHELNNPLQSVLGHLELLRATGEVGRSLRPQIHTISREADRAAKIVKNLLVFAGSRRLAKRPVQVNAVLRRVVRSRQSACRAAHIEIVRHYDESIPRISSDPLMLHQVFLNVVLNAEQAVIASGRPGRIEIASGADRDRGILTVTVRDTGAGIPDQALSRVFEPFFTTKDVGKGTGLGLAISYGIVHDHGGTIAAGNHPEGGALFTIRLPLDHQHD
jgi:signal transduction histidine kinase